MAGTAAYFTWMERFYFDIRVDTDVTCDDIGVEMESLHAAQREAFAVLPSLAKDLPPDDRNREIVVEVRGKQGGAVFKAILTLSGAHLRERTFA